METEGSQYLINQTAEEEFIDMDIVSPLSSLPKALREFEFQMFSSISSSSSSSSHNNLHFAEKELATTDPSPADELFYKGKLLPLHLPPRLQMVQKLLQTSEDQRTFNKTPDDEKEKEAAEKLINNKIYGASPLIVLKSFTAPPTISNSPLDQSCNISPAESCRASCELNPDDHLFQWSTEPSAFTGCKIGSESSQHARNSSSWSKTTNRMKMLMQSSSSLTHKLRASRAYFKSIFLAKLAGSSGGSDDQAAANKPQEEGGEAWNVLKAREYVNKHISIVKKMNYPFSHMESRSPQQQQQQQQKMQSGSSFTMKNILDREIDEDQTTFTCHRRSFSGALKRRYCASRCYSAAASSSSHSSSKSSSFSSSSSSSSSNCSSNSSFSVSNSANGLFEINLLKATISRTNSSELANSVEGAIAHCKKSQQQIKITTERIISGEKLTPLINMDQVGSCLLSASRLGESNGKPEISRI